MRLAALIQQMDALAASDMFLTPGRVPAIRRQREIQLVSQEAPVTLQEFQEFVREFLPAGTWERFEATRELDMGVSFPKAGRYRLNLSWQTGAPAMAIRKVPEGCLEFSALNLPVELQQLASKQRGLILLTGATGSGKSTTMAAILHYINSNFHRRIVTIEDPIEFIHRDINSVISQREIGSDTHDFHNALRHVVRQNPDVIFIGEIRDAESIRTAISAAMTGHLVCATFHTMDAVQTLERLSGYFPENERQQLMADLAMALNGIACQRLIAGKEGGLYPAFELLEATPLARRVIARQEFQRLRELIRENRDNGMLDFNHSLLKLYRQNLVELENAAAAAEDRDEFMLLVHGMETGTESFRSINDSETTSGGFNLKQLLRNAMRYGASDLLLTAGTPPLIRLNGDLTPFEMPELTPTDTRQLLFSVLSAPQRAEFEAQREIDFALAVSGISDQKNQEFRFRVNGFYQKGRMAAAFRLIASHIPTPEELGVPAAVVRLTQKNQGLILVTGPTGHGKSTTLAALIDRINTTRQCHIITIEDPIEFVHQHKNSVVEQREVGADTHSFQRALKHVLREDPDVILIGEMRDPETIAAALTAAETGHLVLATLHTNDVAQSIDRIIDVFPTAQQGQIRSQLSSSLECVVSQRLLPLNSPEGGRIAAFEVMMGTPAVRALIRDKKNFQLFSVIETSAKDGMITMDKALEQLYENKKITRSTLLAFQRHHRG